MNDDLIKSINYLFHSYNINEIEIPKYGWKARLDWKPPVKCRPFKRPRLHQMNGFVLPALRYLYHVYRPMRKEGKKPFIDSLNPVSWRPIYGVPLGGIGSGAINRGFRGEFCRTSLVPGMYNYSVWQGTQFLVNITKGGEPIYQRVLNVEKSPQDGWKDLSKWDWSFPADKAAYIGLFPQAWTVYDITECGIKLFCRQLSPVMPHNYQDSCLPTCLFEWNSVYYGEDSDPSQYEVTVVFVMIPGSPKQGVQECTVKQLAQISGESHDYKACMLAGHKVNGVDTEMECNFASGVRYGLKQQIGSVRLSNSEYSGGECDADKLWRELSSYAGSLSSDRELDTVERKASGLVLLGKMKPHAQSGGPGTDENRLIFQLAWHMPKVKFTGASITYNRRYTRWIDKSPSIGCFQLIQSGFSKFDQWKHAITDWQKPILNNEKIPDWFKSALFNELYYIVDGGTAWLDVPINSSESSDADTALKVAVDSPQVDSNPLADAVNVRNKHKQEYGIFGYLESHEYRMYNTYDVHHYSSWALVACWPRLQESLQYDIADHTAGHDPTPVTCIHTGTKQARSAPACVPHDLGDPEDEPWIRVNAYTMYNTDHWKDLNCKFALQVYRDYSHTRNLPYLIYMFPIVLDAIKQTLKFDRDGDGVIENCGFADQTYDAWVATGVSAYTGGLWLAAVKAVCEMAEVLEEDCSFLKDILRKGLESYQTKLWTGTHFQYDEYSMSVMADQLNGHWYLRASGINKTADDMLDAEKVLKTLRTVFAHNGTQLTVPKNGSSKSGLVGGLFNGSKSPGVIDTVSVQSEEYWVGVNYSVASLMMLEGMEKEGWKVTEWTYKTVWENLGLQYQTPEAYLKDGRYRALGYMRPMCIWSIHHFLTNARQNQAQDQL